MQVLAAGVLLAGIAFASEYSEAVQKWRAEREARLKAPDGWLSLVGLSWLNAGENSIMGGAMTLDGDRVTWTSPDGRERDKVLKADSDDFVSVQGKKLFIIHRGHRYGVRVKDNNSEYRRSFTRLEWYPVDPSWRITAKYIPFDRPRKKRFNSQAGDPQEMVIPGVVEFARAGKAFRLSPVLEGDEFFFVIRDTTAGKTTYPAARFIYGKARATAGPIEIDFNKAYNPPCVFTPYATCPLPPPENRLSIPVEAGEKMYRSKLH